MKVLVLILIAMFAVTSASAQSLFVKKYENKAYYRTISSKGKEQYYQLPISMEVTEKKLRGMSVDTFISRKKYEEIPVTEEPAYSSTDFQYNHVDAIPNQSSIIVVPIDGRPITSSSVLYPDAHYKLFTVTQAQDLSLVGCPVICRVLERRKSNIGGAEGRLTLLPLFIQTADNQQKPLRPTPIMRRGLNRTNVKFWTTPLIIPLFIPGTGAKILPNETFTLLCE